MTTTTTTTTAAGPRRRFGRVTPLSPLLDRLYSEMSKFLLNYHGTRLTTRILPAAAAAVKEGTEEEKGIARHFV